MFFINYFRIHINIYGETWISFFFVKKKYKNYKNKINQYQGREC